MPYCANCGNEIKDGYKFCAVCGSLVKASTPNEANQTIQQPFTQPVQQPIQQPVKPVDQQPVSQSDSQTGQQHASERKITYDGELRKCPSCGEILNSFVAICPACGYELRGTRASDSVHEFAIRLEQAQTDEQRSALIKSFPIPNTKEDIMEFMILASTNIGNESQNEILDAWVVKFDQCYNKAELIFSNDSDFPKFQSIYDQTKKLINKKKNIRVAKKIGSSVAKSGSSLPRVAIAVGWLVSIFILIPLCGMNVDVAGTNSYQILLMVDFIAGAIVLPFIVRGESSIPSLITVIGLMISIAVLIPLCAQRDDSNLHSAYIMILIVDIISSLVIFIRLFKKKKDKSKKEK